MNVYYIKLGAGGMWEQEFLREGIIRFGYNDTNADLANAGECRS